MSEKGGPRPWEVAWRPPPTQEAPRVSPEARCVTGRRGRIWRPVRAAGHRGHEACPHARPHPGAGRGAGGCGGEDLAPRSGPGAPGLGSGRARSSAPGATVACGRRPQPASDARLQRPAGGAGRFLQRRRALARVLGAQPITRPLRPTESGRAQRQGTEGPLRALQWGVF